MSETLDTWDLAHQVGVKREEILKLIRRGVIPTFDPGAERGGRGSHRKTLVHLKEWEKVRPTVHRMLGRPVPDSAMTDHLVDRLRLIGAKEAAAILGVEAEIVDSWAAAGFLPCVGVGVTQQPRFSVTMLDAWQQQLGANPIDPQVVVVEASRGATRRATRKVREGIRPSLRFMVLRRDNYTCRYCGRSAPDVVLHVDHVEPVVNGGKTDESNLVTSCQDCNLGKGVRPAVAE